MFTGIVDRTARVVALLRAPEGHRITLRIGRWRELPDWTAIEDGESIAVNGVCLTAVAARRAEDGAAWDVDFEAVPETLSLTTLGTLEEDELVNVERSMAAGDRFGGHYVTGHVDGTGCVRHREVEGDQEVFTIEIAPELLRQTLHKGSIAVEGVSLTITTVDRESNTFSFAAIPHTLERTNLGNRTEGTRVNIETDAFGKWVLHGFEQLGLRGGGESLDSNEKTASRDG